MLLNNLELSFDRQEGNKYIFKNAKGEVAIDVDCFDGFEDNGKDIFLAADYSPLIFAEEDRKKLLNKILED